MLILLFIFSALSLLIIGAYIGYEVCKKDYKKSRGKVMNMSERDTFMKRHGLKK